jgi:membrane associated rhomboid family serine protease
MKNQPTKRFVLLGGLVYGLAGAFIAMLISWPESSIYTGRFSMDQLRPLIAGLTAMTAISAWIFVMPTTRETWKYTRLWAICAIAALCTGFAVSVYYGMLSSVQGEKAIGGTLLGILVGWIQVCNARLKDTQGRFRGSTERKELP